MDVQVFLDGLAQLDVGFFTGVPDSLLKPLNDALYRAYGVTGRHVVAADEGGAVALAAGHTIATGKPAMVYLQNSGIGNAVNPIGSLLHERVYGIPAVFVVGWRGEPGVPDEPQHAYQGEATPAMLALLGLTVFTLDRDTGAEAFADMLAACRPLLKRGCSVAFLVRKQGLTGDEATLPTGESRLTREAALCALLEHAGTRDYFVVTTGKASREVFELREALKQPHDHDFLTVGSMGHAGMIALGIAMARPADTVWCLDGDGAALMHLGALAVEAQQHALNLIHVVLNNGAHESVGGMPVAGGHFWFAPLARAAGFDSVFTAESAGELRGILPRVREAAKTRLSFLEILLCQGSRADLGRPTQSPRENLTCLRKAWER